MLPDLRHYYSQNNLEMIHFDLPSLNLKENWRYTFGTPNIDDHMIMLCGDFPHLAPPINPTKTTICLL